MMAKTLFKAEPDEVAFEEEFYPGTKCGNIFFTDDRKYSFICEFCVEPFDNMIQFGVHLEANHFSGNMDNEQLGNHEMKLEINNSSFNEELSTSQATNREIKMEIDEGSYRESTLNLHVSLPQNESFVDQVALDKAESLPSSSHDEDKMYCVTCNQHYSSRNTFRNHMWRHKKNKISGTKRPNISPVSEEAIAEDSKVFCEFCNHGFKFKSTFRAHVVSVHGNSIPMVFQGDPTYLACDRCNQPFETPLERHEHEQMHKSDDPYHCSQCSKIFASRNNRRSHIIIHDGVRPYPCPHCSLTFRRRSNVNEHIRVHLGLKPFPCETCGKPFKTTGERNEHSSIHTNEKPYECKECGARFRLKSNLQQHLHHHSDKRYKCDHCGIECVSARKLKNHLVKHSDERPHVCSECQATFKYPSALKKHLRMHERLKSQKEIYQKLE